MSQNKLIEQIGDHLISLKTLRRIENGNQSVSDELIELLLDYFGIDLSYKLRDPYEELLAEQNIGDYLGESDKDEEELRDLDNEDLSNNADGIVERIKNVNHEIMLYRKLFSQKPDMPYDFHIYNIVIFVYYLPLIDVNDLNEVFTRMEGSFRGRLNYFLTQLEYLYKKIPDSQLKSDVDDIVREMIDPEYEASWESHKRYKDFLEKKYEVYNNIKYCYEEYMKYRKDLQELGHDST